MVEVLFILDSSGTLDCSVGTVDLSVTKRFAMGGAIILSNPSHLSGSTVSSVGRLDTWLAAGLVLDDVVFVEAED